uniref:Uncharacterized protein n=1 Tax=Haptolina brevifila TaxID=156173 RepID=A0A7S2DNA8_9EUKA
MMEHCSTCRCAQRDVDGSVDGLLQVGLLNVPLLVPAGARALSLLMSDDTTVAHNFRQLILVLVVHSQSRIVDLTCASVLVPMGKPRMRVGIAVFSFWLVATPIASVGALTNAFTTSVLVKVQLCVACTSIGQVLNALCYGGYLLRLDWSDAARLITARANTDAGGTDARGTDTRECGSAHHDAGCFSPADADAARSDAIIMDESRTHNAGPAALQQSVWVRESIQ